MSVSAPAPKDSPLMQAWEAYQATPEYSNSKGWAMQIAPIVHHGHPDEEAMRRFDIMPRALREVHIQGALWAAFMAGFNASRTEAEQAFHRPTWKAALTLAHNLCAQYSNRHNDNDETEQADALNEMCGHIKPYLDCTDEEIAEMVAEANPSSYVKVADQ